MEKNPLKKPSKEEVADAQIGLLEWELEEREREYGIDHLTGVHTRRAFDKRLAHEFDLFNKEEHRKGVEPLTKLSLVFVDLDNFKRVNDTLGHDQGDQVLKRAAWLLQGALREGDYIARYGGDEFVVLLPNQDNGEAAQVAEKLRSVLDSDKDLNDLGVTGSLGIASALAGMTPTDLLKSADTAVYVAKQGGRNQIKNSQ